MNLVIDGEAKKVNNFVNFLIENHAEEGKTYEFELVVQDKYDRKLIDKRIKSLNNNLLLFLNDEFEIIDQNTFDNYNSFLSEIGNLFDIELKDELNEENYKNQFVKYKLIVNDGDKKSEFSFYYLDLNA